MIIPLIVAGCGDTPESQIYNQLEEAVQLEEGFQQQQEAITQLETKEHDLYNQIIELGIDEFDKIKDLAQQALTSIEERTEKIKMEKESLATSREAFTKVESFVQDIKDTEVKEKAEKLYDTMISRYDAYDKLNKAYNESLSLEKQLYEMLQLEDLDQAALQEQIEKINVKYQEIIKANEEFNSFTNEYNELKKGFYEQANINVKYVENNTK